MKVILFGATGMVGQGVLRECLLDPEIVAVLAVVRTPTGQTHPKLRELIHGDFFDFSSVADALTGYDACFYCLGVTSAGMTEAAYRRVTYDITLAAARVLVERNPGMTFVFVSGAGTDSTGSGRVMWARVKGQTENAVRQLPFKAVYCVRPGIIQPMHGIKSKTALYRVFYVLLRPVTAVARLLVPRAVTTTEELARAMLEVAKHGAPTPIVDGGAFRQLAHAGRHMASA